MWLSIAKMAFQTGAHVMKNRQQTKMLVSEPLAMASAAGWYIGQLCKEDDFPMPFDRFTEYMSKEDALKLLKEDIF